MEWVAEVGGAEEHEQGPEAPEVVGLGGGVVGHGPPRCEEPRDLRRAVRRGRRLVTEALIDTAGAVEIDEDPAAFVAASIQGLQVSMDAVLLVQVRERFAEMVRDEAHLSSRVSSICDGSAMSNSQ